MSTTGPKTTTTEAFAIERDRLHAIAHRVLGSHSDADDAVQEAWLRLSRQDTDGIENLAGWLTTVVSRLSVDILRSRQAHPVVSYDEMSTGAAAAAAAAQDIPGPEDDVALADSIGRALLVVLDTLSPDERLTFVLHEVFAVPHADIGVILGKSTDATKMLASRARRKVRGAPGQLTVTGQQRDVVRAFLRAAREGNFTDLLRVLHPDVELTAHTPAGTFVTLGATEVAARAELGAATARAREADVNGRPGVIAWREDGTPHSVLSFTVLDGRITHITALVDPDQLARMDLPGPSLRQT